MPVTRDMIREALPAGGLFGGGAWRWSPEPLPIPKRDARKLAALGHPLAMFLRTCDEIYRRSADGRLAGWIARLLDTGKPDWLIAHQRTRATEGHVPRVIRPDLLWTRDGFALAEIDSVPGGIGLTAWLSRLYASAGHEVLGGPEGMLDGFRSMMPNGGDVLVSRESDDYRPEMEWLCGELGDAWKCSSAEAFDARQARDVYRFFELFDWESVPSSMALAQRVEAGLADVTPPLRPHLEEKLWLALLRAPSLRSVWKSMLRADHLERLLDIVPLGWVVDPTPLPPLAGLPWLDAHSWEDVAEFSQKQRELVLKVSGFSERAWGSRGVFIGHDLPSGEWRARIHQALQERASSPWIMQAFHEAKVIRHPVYTEDGGVVRMDLRARLCPYYFTTPAGHTSFAGCLATLVPADKKKIHGMSAGILVPCVVE